MINISIIENDGAFSERIKMLLNEYFAERKIERYINISEYSSVSDKKINWGEYCFLNTENPHAEDVAKDVKGRYRSTQIVFVGEEYSQKNINLAVEGYFWGLSGFIIKSFSDSEIFSVFDCLFLQ